MQFKQNVARGVKGQTRAQTLINDVEVKLQLAAGRYRRARTAMTTLDPDGDWKSTYRVLLADDIRWVSEAANEATGDVPLPTNSRPEGRERENRRSVSWIWMVGAGDPDAEEWKNCGKS